MKRHILPLVFATTIALQGCTGLVLGGVVAAGAAVASVAHDRRTPGTVVDDKNLALKLAKKIRDNKSVDKQSHTNLAVFNGWVLITGEANNQTVIDGILALVRNTTGVRRIENALAIMPQSSVFRRGNDAIITGKVKTALLSLKLPNFDPTLVNVSTERGNVYIMGLVTPREARAIITRARQVSGVRSVTDVFEYIRPDQLKTEQ